MTYETIPFEFDTSELNGLGFLGRITSDADLEEKFKSLVRGAAVKVLKREGVTTFQAISEVDPALSDELFQDDLNVETLDRLRFAGIEPMSERKMKDEINSILRDELSELEYGTLGWNPFKAIKKVAKKAVRKVKKARKKFSRYATARARAVRRGATRAARKLGQGAKKAVKAVVKAHKFVYDLHKKAIKSVAKLVKNNLPLIKKVAIVAAVGAAIYFGGPLVIAGLKTAGPALLAKAKSLGPIAKKVMGKLGIGKGEITDPNDPRLAEVNAEMQKEILAQKGINMDSPEAQQFLLENGQYQNTKLHGGGGFNAGTAALIAVPAVAAFFLLG